MPTGDADAPIETWVTIKYQRSGTNEVVAATRVVLVSIASVLEEWGLAEWQTGGGCTCYGVEVPQLGGEIYLTDNNASVPTEWREDCGLYFIPTHGGAATSDALEEGREFASVAEFVEWVAAQETSTCNPVCVLSRWVEAGIATTPKPICDKDSTDLRKLYDDPPEGNHDDPEWHAEDGSKGIGCEHCDAIFETADEADAHENSHARTMV